MSLTHKGTTRSRGMTYAQHTQLDKFKNQKGEKAVKGHLKWKVMFIKHDGITYEVNYKYNQKRNSLNVGNCWDVEVPVTVEDQKFKMLLATKLSIIINVEAAQKAAKRAEKK